MNFLHLPERTKKKRTYGLTSIIDMGIPTNILNEWLQDYGVYIDFAKIGIGTAAVTPNIKEKVDLYRSFGIHPYFGGTFFEKSYDQNKLPEYIASLKKLNIDWIEISTGTIDIPLKKRVQLISEFKQEFSILGEVGSKDVTKTMSIDEWMNEIETLLDAGCKYVITEGRDSGTSGIYDQTGKVNASLIDQLVKRIDTSSIIFEAPTAKQQMYFINAIGPNVNIGNVKLTDCLALEAQRCGLRSETFHMEVIPCK
ncbi:phosphosulfolactate synthase [Fervidibacillus albus]|uniref:Phosphosulfolactate synthase n=1 Tax=Fervidibacillus albus TaxID=2980026 RepID=A0A9E8LWD4_9BACI|nr:phosphosulfolactate synthase [Fervidibacillus albus]WAA10928.1 phosphosulfolactate synthase [Fervidibacillus albus]